MLDAAIIKLALLMEMFNRDGEITLSNDARQGMYGLLSDINDTIVAASIAENAEDKEGGE